MGDASVNPVEDFRLSHRAVKYEGGDEIPVSMFLVRYERGDVVGLHTHPYAELFVVEEGTGVFTVGEDEIEVAAGNIVVVPAETPHSFRNDRDEVLSVHSVHPSPSVQQTDLE
jgi:quercetin dioxygenase-like cupin family protein